MRLSWAAVYFDFFLGLVTLSPLSAAGLLGVAVASGGSGRLNGRVGPAMCGGIMPFMSCTATGMLSNPTVGPDLWGGMAPIVVAVGMLLSMIRSSSDRFVAVPRRLRGLVLSVDSGVVDAIDGTYPKGWAVVLDCWLALVLGSVGEL